MPSEEELFIESGKAFLEHHGVKGMRWGSRKRDGVSRGTDRQAKKDAKEFARAKMFYGQGAGTRRKLINKAVEAKKGRDPAYAKAFDRHLATQQLDKHAEKASAERRRADFKDKNKKRAGYLARRATGEMGTQAAFAAVAVGGAAFIRSPKGRAILNKNYNLIKNKVATKKNAAMINNLIRKSGFK